MGSRGQKMVQMVKEQYKLRKKTKIDYGEKSPESLMDFSSGSSDNFTPHSSDYSGESYEERDCGYLEVSLEHLKQTAESLDHNSSTIMHPEKTTSSTDINMDALQSHDPYEFNNVENDYINVNLEKRIRNNFEVSLENQNTKSLKNNYSGLNTKIANSSANSNGSNMKTNQLNIEYSHPQHDPEDGLTDLDVPIELKEINSPSKSRDSICSDSVECENESLSNGSLDLETSAKKLTTSPDILPMPSIIYNSCQPEDNGILSLTTSAIQQHIPNPKNLPDTNIDRILNNFGSIIKDKTIHTVDLIENQRRWTKKNCCPYCFVEVTHFPRHLQRNHEDEGAVKELLLLSSSDPKRKILLSSLRRQGNFALHKENIKMRPVKRPRNAINEEYLPCNYCLGFFKKQYLKKHRKKCQMNSCPQKQRENHQSESQAFVICSGTYKEFYDSLRLKKEVLNKMRVDETSKIVMSDILICSYGESQLKRHKRVQLATMVSNKLRELVRLLLVLREMTGCNRFLDILKPEFFDNLVTATKVISGYNEANKNFRAPSLALHMSTRLIQVCDIATKMIIKKHRFLECKDPEGTLKNIKRLRSLIVGHWNYEISSLALKDLNEKQWEKPKMFPLTSEIMQFQKYVMNEAETACENINAKKQLEVHFRRLTECIMALTLLLNRKRIGEIQFLKIDTYQIDMTSNHQQEIMDSLSENEKILTRNFKRVVTGGKGSKPVVILFPKKIQSLIDIMLSVRSECVSKENKYLFANPKTDSRWLSGYHVLKKLAQQSGVSNKDLFTSTRLRKQIATVLQVMNIGESEMEQFANFMGHTKKTHEEYYRLPQDLYQTAKVSKILIAINNGKGAQYKGKTLDEIDFSDNVDSDNSDHEDTNVSATKRILKRSKTSLTESPSAAYDVPGASKILKKTVSSPAVSETPFSYSDSSKYSSDSSANSEVGQPVQKRKAWNETQAKILRTFFAKHIKEKIASKKHEVELLIKEHPTVFKGRKWVTIKAYVYNCYRLENNKNK